MTEGIFNNSSSDYAEPSKTLVSFKYKDKIRLCLGVASVKMPCGTVVGKRADLIDYTGKVVISEEEEIKKMQSEIEKVKKNGEKKWITYAYPSDYNSNSIFDLDSLFVLKQIGTAVWQRLQEKKAFLCVKDLKMRENKSNNELKLLKVYSLCIQTLKNAILQSLKALPGSRPRPTLINHAIMPNPYEYLYGSEWKQVILTTTMKRFISIDRLIQQIYENTKKLFSRIIYENDFYFYHNALNLMTSPS